MSPYAVGSLITTCTTRRPLIDPLRAAAVGLALTMILLSPAGALRAAPIPVRTVSSPNLITVCVNGNLWVDGGLEATDPLDLFNPNYVTTSTLFGIGPRTPNGTPLCNVGNVTCQDGQNPRNGNSWAWFGGNNESTVTAEIDSAEQTVTFPAGATSVILNFYLRIGFVTAPFTDTLEIQVDGVTQQTFVEPSTPESSYTLRSLDLTAFADGAAHAVKFLYTQKDMPSTPVFNKANFDVDDVTLDIACAALTPMALAVDASGNGILEPGELATLEPTWRNDSAVPISLTGDTSNFTGPPGPTYDNPDAAAAYGTVGAGASAKCTDCYTVQVTAASRPGAHWDATIDEAAGAGAKTWTLHVGGSFPDVPTSHQFYGFIETIFHKGVTSGCASVPNYCPGDAALRKQMAVFVLKSKEGPAYTPPPAVGIFNDVPASDPFAPWIEELYHRGVVAGCNAPGGPNYCPNNPVLRQQMSVFLLKTLLGSSYVPPVCTGIFPDVTCPSLFADWIEDLFHRGITGGCGGGNYCPTNPNTRGQMAVFLTKTFSLVLYGP
ncbi:MAG: S-layer homology domain-containing protein [Thermoanaerobaculia bacterium]